MTRRPPPTPVVEIKKTLTRGSGEASVARAYRALKKSDVALLKKCSEDGTTELFEKALASAFVSGITPLFVDHALLRWLSNRKELRIRSRALLQLICDSYQADPDDILIDSDGVIAGIFANETLMGFMPENTLLTIVLRRDGNRQIDMCREDGTTESFGQALANALNQDLTAEFVDHSMCRWLNDRGAFKITSKSLMRILRAYYRADADDILIESDGKVVGIFVNDELIGFMPQKALLNLSGRTDPSRGPRQQNRRPSRRGGSPRRTRRPASPPQPSLPPIGGLIKTRYGLVPADSRIFREQLRDQSLGVNDQPRTRLKHN